VESIVAEATRLAAEGVKEINLISQDTVNYGVDLGPAPRPRHAASRTGHGERCALDQAILSLPQQVSDELLDLYVGEEKITKYIDMRCNTSMIGCSADAPTGRSGRHHLPRRSDQDAHSGVSFRTAFIVGFPGETEQAFDELKDYVREAQFDRVAVFLYSDEEDTPAVGLDDKVERSVMDGRRNES